MTDYSEIFCEAVNQIVQNSVNGLEYDITKDCTVVSVKNKLNHEYLVSDGSSTFIAYAAENASYALGDVVLVNIPKGDYNAQKTILNRVITEDSMPIGYTNPLESFIKGTGDLIQVKTPISITANGTSADAHICTIEDSNESYFGFTRLGLSAEFMTLLSGQGVIKGEYGLKIAVYGNAADSAVTDFTFSASEMLGNPYEFVSYFKQEAVFDIPTNISHITKIEVYLYQDGKFEDGSGNPIEDIGVDNIFVQNMTLYLGFQGNYTQKEMLNISTIDKTYTSSDNIRNVALRWFHKIDDGVYEPINALNWDDDIHEIRWYQYVSGCPEGNTDEYGGKNWKWMNQDGEPELTHADYPFMLPFTLSDTKTVEKVKAIAFITEHPLQNDPTYEKTTHYESDVLEFTNSDESTSGGETTEEQLKEMLSLNFDDNSFGNYFLYDQNNSLPNMSTEGSSKERTVSLFAYGVPLNEDVEVFDSVEYVRWEVPAPENSMLIFKEEEKFQNPNENLLPETWSNNEEKIEYSNCGKFTLKFKINDADDENKLFATEGSTYKIKAYLYTATEDNEDGWKSTSKNRPYSAPISLSPKKEEYTTTFTVNRVYKYFKLVLKYYIDDVEQVDMNIIQPNTADFRLKAAFFTKTDAPKVTDDGNRVTPRFKYSIENIWDRGKSSNTIKCTVGLKNGVTLILSETARFGIKGTSGTSNTFLLEMMGGKNGLTVDGSDNILKVKAMLIGSNGRSVSLSKAAQDGEIEWELINGNSKYIVIDGATENYGIGPYVPSGEGAEPIITLKLGTEITALPKDNYAILQAKYKYGVADESSGKTPYLYAFLPIPLKSENCIGMKGPTEIIYNHMGQPRTGDESYTAFGSDGTERYWWKLNSSNNNPNPISLKTNNTIVNNGSRHSDEIEGEGNDEGLILYPSPLYAIIEENSAIIQDQVCAYCYKKNNGVDKVVWWSQPILIMQSQYDFAMLNEWDGKTLVMNEEKGTILGVMLGAGKKDDQNRFSGVLMGDVRTGTDLDDTTALTGVYGFQTGQMTYGLQENGTAFFGAEAKGRIEIDGQHGAIHSYGWTPEYKTNYTKWTLDSSKASKGSVFDLDDGQLQLCADANNYLKYNDNNSGKLEMSLSGANIKLTDKENKSLSGYIDITAKGLTSEFRKTAVYAIRCDTKDGAANKVLKLSDFSKYAFKNTGDNDNSSIGDLKLEDLYCDGLTIAVTFTNAETVTSKNIEIKQEIEGTEETIGFKEQRQGRALSFKINNDIKPIYINEKATNNTASCDDEGNANSGSNPFGWSAGSTIYFTYRCDDKGSNGRWEVSDSGSYSRITQTADMIKSEVSNIAGTLGSAITQTAGNIRMEVARTANYICTCKSPADNESKYIRLNKTDYDKLEKSEGIESGLTLLITFDEGNTITDENIYFKLCQDLEDSADVKNSVIHGSGILLSPQKINKGEALPFVFNGTNWIMTTLSNAYIDIKEDSITAAVASGLQYVGVSNDAADIKNKTATLDTDFTLLHGVTVAISFTNGNNDDSNNAQRTLDVAGSGSKPIYKKISNGWSEGLGERSEGEIVAFIYDKTNDWWKETKNGAYSRIQQNANNISAKVSNSHKGTSFGWNLTDSGFYMVDNGNDASASNYIFSCDSNGLKIKGDGEFTGKITATTGSIGGFNIGAPKNDTSVDTTKSLYANALSKRLVVTKENGDFSKCYEVGIKTGSQAGNLVFYVAETTKEDWSDRKNVFYVKHNGEVGCSNLKATGGTIGGWNINDSSLYIGTAGAENGIKFSKESFSTTNKIAGSNSNWRLTIGNNFGVTGKGNLYCNGLYASGGTIGGDVIIKGELQGATGTFSGSIGASSARAGDIYAAILDCTKFDCGGTAEFGGQITFDKNKECKLPSGEKIKIYNTTETKYQSLAEYIGYIVDQLT